MYVGDFQIRATLEGGPLSILQGSAGTASEASASSQISSSYPASEAWDGVKDGSDTTNNAWISNNTNPPASDGSLWIQWDFTEAKTLLGFRFQAREATGYDQWPDDVKVLGKTSAQSWAEATTLYDGAISGASSMVPGDWCSWHSLTTTGAFDSYRIEVHSAYIYAGAFDRVSIQEFEFQYLGANLQNREVWVDDISAVAELEADRPAIPFMVECDLEAATASVTTIDRSRHYYRATITGWQDGLSDLVVPISSLQARSRSGNPTYVNVVIPGVDAYAADIADRENGELVVELVYRNSAGEDVQEEEIARVDIEDIQTHEGGRSASIVIEGRRTLSYTAKTVALTGSVYRRLSYGRLSYRFVEPDPYLRPGDTVTTDQGDSFTVDSITYILTPAQQSMELHEEAA